MKHRFLLLELMSIVVLFAYATSAFAAETYTGPVKEIFSGRIGSEVNKVTKGKICLLTEECQQGMPSTEPGGFEFAKGIAVDGDQASPQYGHVYVLDGTHRVQELEADGSFVSTFGWDVNKTKVAKGGATQQEMNICTEIEIMAGGECQAGVEGSAPGQFGEEQSSIAVDPANGEVYVTDRVKANVGGKTTNGVRVQKFTSDGHWVLEIGKEVNETKDGAGGASAEAKDLCTEQEVESVSVKCTGPAQFEFGAEPSSNSTEPGVFPIENPAVATVGGREGLLYVGAGQRAQEFLTEGSYKGQVPIAGTVGKMTLDNSCQLHEPVLTESTTPTCASFDPSYGDLYVVYSQGGTVVHKLDPNGVVLTEFPLSARGENSGEFLLDALAVDSAGRLAVSEGEQGNAGFVSFGSLLSSATGHLITEFQVPASEALRGLAFSVSDQMYSDVHDEVLSYTPVHVAELLTRPTHCTPGGESETDVTFDCTLNGEANPEEVTFTEVSFQWGFTFAVDEATPVEPLCTTVCSNTSIAVTPTVIKSVRPNQTVYYRLAAHDQNVKTPELLTSDTASFVTPVVAPRIVGGPSSSFVKSSSAVLFNELNPENAPTEYYFEYGQTLGIYCAGGLRTKTIQAATYGKMGATLEATGLQPDTTYQYRICATNQAGTAVDEHGENKIQEASFTTLAAPVPQATTGLPSAIATTSATVSGTVNPDGQPATYAFELGIYRGASTQYGTVFSGPAGASTTPIEEKLALTGLQPGTTYAYRLKIKSGYGESTGTTLTFTTAGLPEVLPKVITLGLLPTPPIAFPKTSAKITPKKLTRAQELARALKACGKKPKGKRATCKRNAHKKFAVSKSSAHKSKPQNKHS
jgi:hypothetical protein